MENSDISGNNIAVEKSVSMSDASDNTSSCSSISSNKTVVCASQLQQTAAHEVINPMRKSTRSRVDEDDGESNDHGTPSKRIRLTNPGGTETETAVPPRPLPSLKEQFLTKHSKELESLDNWINKVQREYKFEDGMIRRYKDLIETFSCDEERVKEFRSKLVQFEQRANFSKHFSDRLVNLQSVIKNGAAFLDNGQQVMEAKYMLRNLWGELSHINNAIRSDDMVGNINRGMHREDPLLGCPLPNVHPEDVIGEVGGCEGEEAMRRRETATGGGK